MSRKSYKTQYISVDRIPTKREVEWAKQRNAAGGPTDLVRRGFTLPGVEASAFGGHGALAHSLQTTEGREALSRGIARQAFREDPFAYMTEEQIRDHYTGLDDGLKTGLSEKQIASVAAEAWTRARLRQRERLNVLEDPFYVPGKGAPDFSANRQLEFGEPGLVGDVLGKPPKKGSGGESVGRAKKRQAEEAVGAVPKGKVKFGKGSKKGTRQAVLGGETDEEKPWRRDQTDGSYVTRNEGNGSYQWYNKDGTLRGEAKDYQEIGNGGRVFFGDLSTGAGRVTIGGDERNATDVTGFKMSTGDDGSTTFNYSTGRSQRSFSYNADGTMKTAGSKATATYQNGDKASLVSTYDPTEHRDAKGNVISAAGMTHEKIEGGGEYVRLSGEMQDRKDALAATGAGRGATVTDRQRQDYLDKLSNGVAAALDEKNLVTQGRERVGGQLNSAVKTYQATGEAGQLDRAKQLAATQVGLQAMSHANQDVARLERDPLTRKELVEVGKAARKSVLNNPGMAESLVAGRSDLWGPAPGEAKGVGGPGAYYVGDPSVVSAAVGKPWRLADTFSPRRKRRRWGAVQADNKGGTTRDDLFVDAADPAAQGPNTNTVRGRIEAAMGDAERLAYSRIQKRFQEKHGREMDVDVARIRAMMDTGLLNRTSARQFARELRAERDMSIARQLADQAVGSMPRDAQGYLVPESMDPGRRLGEVWLNESGTVRAPDSWEARQGRVQNVLSGGRHSAHNPGVADGSKLTAAQKLFLAHRYHLAPEVRRVHAFSIAPGASGEYGTVERGADPVTVHRPGAFYDPDRRAVLPARSPQLARAQARSAEAEAKVDAALAARRWLGFLPGAERRADDAVLSVVRGAERTRLVLLEDANPIPATWWERTGKWYPRGRKGVKFDPNFRGIRAWGTNQGAKSGRTTR